MTPIWVSSVQNLACSTVYWKNIDHDIETMTQNCDACNKFQNQVPKVPPIHHWEKATKSWSRLQTDFALTINNIFLLITIDA